MLATILIAILFLTQITLQHLATPPLSTSDFSTIYLHATPPNLTPTTTPTPDPTTFFQPPVFHLADHSDDSITATATRTGINAACPRPKQTNPSPNHPPSPTTASSKPPTPQPTHPPASPTQPNTFTTTPSTPNLPFPTALLSQLPSTWPYTTPGMGRAPATRTWDVRDQAGTKVGEVRHCVLFWARPLRGRGGRGGGVYDGAGWGRRFVVVGGGDGGEMEC